MPFADEAVRSVSLSALELDVLREHLELDSFPLVLKVPSPGRTHTERAELVDSAWRALSARGLGEPMRVDPQLERMLRLLARPRREVDVRLWLRRSVRVLAAADQDLHEEAVLVVKDGDAFTLRPAAPTGLPREAVSVLPSAGAGPGRSVTVRSEDLDAAAEAAGDSVEELRAALGHRGVRAEDAEALVRMVGGITATGQFGAAARDRWGKRLRAAHVIGFLDGPHGRYVQLRRQSPSGDQWSTIAPVDGRRLIGHVEELLGSVTH